MNVGSKKEIDKVFAGPAERVEDIIDRLFGLMKARQMI